MIPGLSSICHWTVTHTAAPIGLKVMTHERCESVCCSLSPGLAHSLSFQPELPFLLKHSGKVLLPREDPFPAFFSETVLPTAHIFHSGAYSLSKTARSKCHPFSFINSLSEFAQVTCFQLLLSSRESTGGFLHGKSISTAEGLRSSLKHDSWDVPPGKLVLCGSEEAS